MQVELILEQAGLRKGIEYIAQGEGLALKSESGSHQKPDFIIHIPGDKHLVIDSKVSLTSFYKAVKEDDASKKSLYLKEHLKSVQAHIKKLSEQYYQHNSDLDSPDFVLLFMPLEHAFTLASSQNTNFFSEAWGKKVIPVTPSNLFAILKTVSNLWRVEQQNKNAESIAEEGGKLFDKFCDFLKDLDNVGKSLEKVQGSYSQAINKLSSGRGNLIKRAEKLKELGAKTRKELPLSSQSSEEIFKLK